MEESGVAHDSGGMVYGQTSSILRGGDRFVVIVVLVGCALFRCMLVEAHLIFS